MTSLTERELAAKYTGSFAWPTVLLFLALVTGYSAVAVAGVRGVLPMWICMLINGVLAYGFYTIHHESNHKNISGRYSQFRWIDHLLGNIAAIPLHLNFVAYAPSHLQHHAHTNDPERDPDSFLAGPGKAIFPRWIVSTIVKTLLSIPGVNKLMPLVLPEPLATTAREFTTKRKGMMYYNQACLGVLVLSFAAGVGSEVLMLWWFPAQIGALILQVWFVWLPHHDFSQTARYKNTRIRGWWGSTIMLLGQDHHLIHHLYPRVPFYNYRKLFREISDSLIDQGATIQIAGIRN